MAPLPSYAKPPVTEVVISSRFQPLPAYSVVTVGELGNGLARQGFPRIEERPGYEAPIERFGAASEVNQISLEVLTGPPPTRYWFLNDAGDELLQLQPDWLAANWRKVAPDAAYGRWDSRWKAFEGWIEQVERVVAQGERLDHTQVEVTYINHIDPGEVWSSHADAPRVFSFMSDPAASFLPVADERRAELKFVMPDDDGLPIGRLQVVITPGFRRPGTEPVFLMNLTARGRPIGDGLDGVRRFAELAHEWIVRGFTDLTTPEMHRVWQREHLGEHDT